MITHFLTLHRLPVEVGLRGLSNGEFFRTQLMLGRWGEVGSIKTKTIGLKSQNLPRELG